MRGLFVTATDTGVGKTILCAALLAAMAADGRRVRAHKPVLTGLEDRAQIAARGRWPPDHELLGAAADMDPAEVAPLRYGPACSPHLAAKLAAQPIGPEQLLRAALAAAQTGPSAATVIVEGVGGLLVPLTDDYTVRDLACALALPVLLAARPGLGTINHTLLSLHAARSAGSRGPRGRAHPLAGAADRARTLQPREHRATRRRRGGHPRPRRRPGPRRARAGGPIPAVGTLARSCVTASYATRDRLPCSDPACKVAVTPETTPSGERILVLSGRVRGAVLLGAFALAFTVGLVASAGAKLLVTSEITSPAGPGGTIYPFDNAKLTTENGCVAFSTSMPSRG